MNYEDMEGSDSLGIYVTGRKYCEKHENLSSYIQFPDRYLNPEPIEHEAGVPTTQLRLLIVVS
jgi:hypothetical protein